MQQSKPREDNYRHKGLRKQLVETLRKKGITDEMVLAVIERIPRHLFLDTAFEQYAYEDRAFHILANQTISQPFTVAFQTQLLNVKKFDKVLEIGTGSAYQTCVLAELCASVYSIERQRELYEFVSKFSFLQNYPNIKRFYGDGFQGLSTFAPFDKIIVTAAAPLIPPKLIEQLKPGGVAVMPVGSDMGQKMLRITKDQSGVIFKEELGDFMFVPMLTGKNK
ncbi:MAG: protein-L-isoaspartate(D-aspartate) O-methyltransferase [Bacteroidetes bacterium]|nr:protein-L-isoaspartate(D-aspartate) O-methyltransferase [Bacteroidota bacterium]MBS1741315.1 protein-L-isoaspartate(D-aspartate) O-methyltransferase [Bacteroidota bacterium]MBS1776247.1 protein-L-isoaspartate(D-aspartate) O-methyltransferase [Bacteroidota bacterium]